MRASLFILPIALAATVGCSSGNTVIDLPITDAAPDPAKPDAYFAPPIDDASALDAAVDGHGDDHFVWPDCTQQPAGVPTKSIAEVWSDNPAKPLQVWLPGVYVTALSKGACTAGNACDVYVQQDVTYPSLAAGAHKAIKLFVSPNTSMYFPALAVDDRIDVMAWAYRNHQNNQNELILEVLQTLPGCAHKVGTGKTTPVSGVQLSDLTLAAIEDTTGPLYVQVTSVRGTPGLPGETFGLGNAFFDGGGGGAIVSLSPFCRTGGVFAGLVQGKKTTFKSVSGVFGLFTPASDASVAKYLEIYPRTMTEVVQ